MLFARFDVDSDGLLDEEETKRHMAWFNEEPNAGIHTGIVLIQSASITIVKHIERASCSRQRFFLFAK